MLLTKTSLAHDALQAGPGSSLSLADRRVLILADGKRSLNDVVALLGADSLGVVTRLLQEGYLRDGSKPDAAPVRPAQPSGVAGALTGLLRATTEAMQARTDALRTSNAREPLVATPPAAPPIATPAPAAIPARTTMPAAPVPAASRQRRSMVAAKMYMVDMLQLQRHPDAVDLKARIQCCNDQDELLALLLEAAQALRRLTSESFGARIVARLREVLPDEALPALEQAFRPVAADGADALPRIRLVGS